MFEKDGKWYIEGSETAYDSKEAAQAVLDASKKDNSPSMEELMEQINKLKGHNELLIGEKRAAKAKAEKEAADKMAKLKEEAKLSTSDKKKLEVATMELDSLKKKLHEKEEMEAKFKAKELDSKIIKRFKTELGDATFHDEYLALKALDKSKFIEEEDGKFNADGVKQAVSEFRDKYSFMVKPKDGEPNGEAPKGKSHKEELSDSEAQDKYLLQDIK